MGADEQDRVKEGEITHRRDISDAAPPAYCGQSSHDMAIKNNQDKDKAKDPDTTSIHSSIPPDSPRPSVSRPESPALTRSNTKVDPLTLPGPATVPTDQHHDVDPPYESRPSMAPPAYVASESEKPIEKHLRLIAIPQLLPYPDVGLLAGYPPSLLAFGIPEQTWLSFIATVSSFLEATMPQQAISHASKIARSTAKIPRDLARGITSDTVDGLKYIKESARRGNLFGIVGTVIGVPLSTVGRTVGSIFSLHSTLVGGIVEKPETPRERAEIYIASANKRWLNPRGLSGRLVSTAELAELSNVPLATFVKHDQENTATAQQRMDELDQFIAPVKVSEDEFFTYADPIAANPASETKGKRKVKTDSLMLGQATLWLIIVHQESQQAQKIP